MMRYSYMIIDQLETFGGETEIRDFFEHIKDCGYDGVELNLREPSGVDLDRVREWLAAAELSMPSFLTGEAYKEGICLCSADRSVRARAVGRLIEYLDRAAQFDAVGVDHV